MKETPVTILFGGGSEERRVSVASAQNISTALPSAGLFFQHPDGSVTVCDRAALLAHERPFERDFNPTAKKLAPSLAEALAMEDYRSHVYVLALHGGEGEDGTLQQLFEERHIAFTGSGSVCSKKSMDKRLAKRIAAAAGIPVNPEAEISSTEPQRGLEIAREMFLAHHDIVLKPVNGGSSIGLYRVRDGRRLSEVVDEIHRLGDVRYLIEPFVKGKEITVGVVDNGRRVSALPPSEVRLASEDQDFDYDGKYLGKGSLEITPAEIDPRATDLCQYLALTAHHALNCEGYSRTDMILTEKGPVFLETNTLPGLTRASFIPQQLAVAGHSFTSFLDEQIQLAVIRSSAL